MKVLKKITIENKYINSYIYAGTFLPQDNKTVILKIDNLDLILDLEKAIKNTNEVDKLSVKDFKELCEYFNIYSTIYPSLNILYSKLDSSDDELMNCYVSYITSDQREFLICIAFDETQPALYKAQLTGIVEIRN